MSIMLVHCENNNTRCPSLCNRGRNSNRYWAYGQEAMLERTCSGDNIAKKQTEQNRTWWRNCKRQLLIDVVHIKSVWWVVSIIKWQPNGVPLQMLSTLTARWDCCQAVILTGDSAWRTGWLWQRSWFVKGITCLTPGQSHSSCWIWKSE